MDSQFCWDGDRDLEPFFSGVKGPWPRTWLGRASAGPRARSEWVWLDYNIPHLHPSTTLVSVLCHPVPGVLRAICTGMIKAGVGVEEER